MSRPAAPEPSGIALDRGEGFPRPGDVMRGDTLVRLEHVYKIYRVADTGVAALGGVTFDVARGEFVALVGPSGAGKSSILNVIGGMQDFAWVLIITGGGPGYATLVPALHMYERAFTGGQFGYGAAIGLVLFLAILALTLLNQRFLTTAAEAEA